MRKLTTIAIGLICALLVAGPATAGSHQGKKVLYIDSYHEGYDWSDGITAAVEQTLGESGVNLKVIRMDTKRKKSDEEKEQAALQAKTTIEEFHPDVVIASDDNAAKFLIAKFYKDADLPFVFCGVNWDASVYGFPSKNVTGMVEVSPVMELVELLSQYAKGNRIGFLGEDTLTDHKEAEFYEKMLNTKMVKVFANDFEEWKQAFIDLQDQVDILINYNYASIAGWNHEEAARIAVEHGKIPSGAVQAGQINHTMFGYLKIPQEQGRWAAQTALRILDGTSPAEIPVVKNKEGEIMINMKIAEKQGVEVAYELVQSASKVVE